MEDFNPNKELIVISKKQEILTPQPGFPFEEDLSPENAEFMDAFLQNNKLIEAHQDLTEMRHGLHDLSRIAIARAADIFKDRESQVGFSHGFTVYETIAGIVRPKGSELDEVVFNSYAESRAEKLANALTDSEVSDYIIEAREQFTENRPNAASVIAEAAKRIYPQNVDYAVAGAALESQLEQEAHDSQAQYIPYL